MSPRSLPFATHASLAGSCRHLAEDLPGLWSALLGGAQQARGARSSPPSTKDWRALPPLRPGISGCLTSSGPRALRWGWALAAHSVLVLDRVPCVGCLPVSGSESLGHVPTGISGEPLPSEYLALESWSLGLLHRTVQRTQAGTPMDRYFSAKIDFFFFCINMMPPVTFSILFQAPARELTSHQPTWRIHICT